MSIRNGLFFLGTILFLGITFFIIIYKFEMKESNKYFKNLNLFITGMVTNKWVVDHNAGLLDVDVRVTSIKECDTRANNSYYYCVIHQGKAEISEAGLSDIYIGDSIVVDSKIDSFKCFRNGELIAKRRLFRIMDFPYFTRGLRKIHRL